MNILKVQTVMIRLEKYKTYKNVETARLGLN
jgi:hypothetical protein